MRIARALALAGIGSRRECEEHIKNGAVTLNGEVVRDLGRQVDPEQDTLAFRGRVLHFGKYVYFVLNKPAGYTTTASDPHAKKTVYDLLPRTLIQGSRQPKPSRTRVFPVGRLDRDSTGLLLFTNDGVLANRLMHPRYQIGKWYEVKLNRALDPRDGLRLLHGIELEDGIAKIEKFHKRSPRVVRVLIREGKKREVRRIFEKLGYEVMFLLRIAFGPILLGSLPPGGGRFLTSPEVIELKKAVSGSQL
jgi:23S rRNA pseudouridine2605 synthase